MPDRGGGTRTWDPDKSTACKGSAEAFRAAEVDVEAFKVSSGMDLGFLWRSDAECGVLEN
jgi:hypothetical protein